jgi:hypothetical protein
MKTKKLPYGEKARRVRELIAYSAKSDGEIARKVGCHPTYVRSIRVKDYEREAKALEAEGLIQPDDGRVVPIRPAAEPVAEPTVEDELETVLDTRASTYGSFMQSANVAIRLKSVMHNTIAKEDLHLMPDQMLALDMIAVKISRILTGNAGHRDSWLDIAGYAKLVADRLGGVSR